MIGYPEFTGVDWGLLYPDAEASKLVIAVFFGFLFGLYVFTCKNLVTRWLFGAVLHVCFVVMRTLCQILRHALSRRSLQGFDPHGFYLVCLLDTREEGAIHAHINTSALCWSTSYVVISGG